MPWAGPTLELPFPTLGMRVAALIETACVIPDGDLAGEPYKLTDEQLRFLLYWYRLDPETESFAYRRGLLVRPQKWGKGPFAAALICAEAHPEAPVLFDGWDAAGQPVGRPWGTPWIQVTAASEDQTANIWRALKPMIELGPLVDVFPDTGETRINLAGGGLIERVTFAALSRLGQRVTFVVQDESHAWTKSNRGTDVADNQRRNAAGMGGRVLETSNAWDPAEQSVAQQTDRAAKSLEDVLVDYPTPKPGSFRNRRERRAALEHAYGDSYWVDIDRIDGEVLDLILAGELGQAERYFGNRVSSGSGVAFDLEQWAKLAVDLNVPTGRRELITIGFDGARFRDSTALVATHVELGHQWLLGLWEQPAGDDGDGWEVDELEVTERLEFAFDTWDVWRVYADPPYWDPTVNAWAGRWGDDVVVKWWTIRTKAMAYALRRYREAMTSEALSHSGDSAFARHIGNARRRSHPRLLDEEDRPLWTIGKESAGSPDKIDAAMAGCLSWECREDAVASGILAKRRRRGAGGF
jgi:hypothetical protein